MQIGGAKRGNNETFLVHIFGRGLDDERYVVERFRSTADGAISPVPIPEPAARGKKRRRPRHTVASLSNVRNMRPAHDEVIVCTAVNLEDSGVQFWGDGCCLGPHAAAALTGIRRGRPTPGAPPPSPIPNTARRIVGCRPRIRRSNTPAGVSGTGAWLRSGPQQGCARSAEPPGPSPSAGCAPNATGSGARRTAPDTRAPRPPARFMAANAQRPSAAAGAPAARGATTSAAPPAAASGAASVSPPKAAAAASPAGQDETTATSGAGPPTAPMAGVARAAIPHRVAPRAARPAPGSRPAGRRAGITRGRYIHAGARGTPVWTVAPPRKGPRDAPSGARRSYLRSPEHRGLPVSQPRFTVIEIDTGVDHGTYDSPAEVAACLAFAKLGPDDVEIVSDVSVMASLTSW